MADIKIDKVNMCVDRSSEFGKQLDEFNKRASMCTDENEKAFMMQLSAYAEAAMVVDGVVPPEEAKSKIELLVKSMETSITDVNN